MYTNWEEKASFIHPYHWISIPDLAKYLHDLRRYIIFTPSKVSETHVPKLEDAFIPCNKNQRFPDTISYLCEGLSDWKIDLDMLELAVNVMINKNKLERKYPTFKTAGEVEVFALEKINRILHFLQEEQDFVLNRSGFEKLYGLVWEQQKEEI